MNELDIFGAAGPATREGLVALQDVIRNDPEVEEIAVPPEPEHFFAKGLYGRKLDMLSNTVVVGRIHRHEHLAVLLSGSVTIASEFGTEYLEAPQVIVGKAGTKRALFNHTDVSFMTFHATEETDPEVLWETMACDSYKEFDRMLEKLV